MNDDASSRQGQPKGWLGKLSHALQRDPQDKEELVEVLRDAENRDLLDPDALNMIEGVLEVADTQVRDIMIPRSHMVVVETAESVDEFLPKIIDSAHSRFPVIGENRDEVMGILLAKDLLRFSFGTTMLSELNLKDILRPAVFVPESKRLDVLLKEFRQKRYHMAIVVDEYGGVAGLVTIEDVLEQIVGDIEDEHDPEEDTPIKAIGENKFLIQALTPVEDFNEHFSTELSDEEFDTIGGLITNNLGHLPKRGESVTLESFEFRVLSADKRRVRLLEAIKVEG
ncbi:MAG: magnesium/cobalt efflux protein [Legionellales bacterium]|nr:magnesium/cobalt efflux protein [Legionellales bacterium]|tara:strand:- start:72667 stop:73515 length:849 start_codon:yes stop_codon:yes gene_type:complete